MTESWRAGTLDDAEAIRTLTHAVYAKWVPVIGRLPLPMQADYDQALREHEFTLVEIGGKLAGLIETEDCEGYLYIFNVAVAEAHQGRALGRRLVAHAEGRARAKGFGEVRLMTNALYASNIRLYEFLGYETYAREPFQNGVSVRMQKRL
jgi:ribosomal protein S18 acetylase RimI-like enzyme